VKFFSEILLIVMSIMRSPHTAEIIATIG